MEGLPERLEACLRVVLLQVWVIVVGLRHKNHEGLLGLYPCPDQQLGNMVQVGRVGLA